jgi:hypothetical protein
MLSKSFHLVLAASTPLEHQNKTIVKLSQPFRANEEQGGVASADEATLEVCVCVHACVIDEQALFKIITTCNVIYTFIESLHALGLWILVFELCSTQTHHSGPVTA